MLNRTGVRREKFGNVSQILFDVKNQTSVGIVVDDSAGTEESTGRKIVKAGTPLAGSLDARTTPFTAASGSGASNTAVGILLHDVDVTAGDANGTLLIRGSVNTARIDEATRAKITADVKAKLPLITFANMDDVSE